MPSRALPAHKHGDLLPAAGRYPIQSRSLIEWATDRGGDTRMVVEVAVSAG